MIENAASPSVVDPERKNEVSTGPLKFVVGLQPRVEEIKIESEEQGLHDDEPIGNAE